jgi:Zn finger protein HypA/HybF involved in hydrogenase expression
VQLGVTSLTHGRLNQQTQVVHVRLPAQVCIASGKIIRDNATLRCKACKHPMIASEARGLVSCPLCHTPLASSDKARAAAPGVGQY